MDRLWTPWRYSYVTRTEDSARRPGIPPELDAWPGFSHESVAANSEQSSDKTADRSGDCVFCNLIAAVDYAIASGMATDEAERAAHLVVRSATCYICLNAFPYSTGHLLLVPYRHLDSLAAMAAADAAEMMALAQRVERVLRTVYNPGGLNFGLNLGEAGGAGIASHIHMHALPRWIGDTNFMTVTGDTRVLPEKLDTTWERIRQAWQDLGA
jgi:ATP adenylyltransferase